MLVGVAVGPFGLAMLSDQLPLLGAITLNRPESIAPIAELGISMMMFMIGLELSLERLRVMRRLVFGFGLLQFVLCAVAIGAIAYALGAPPVLAAVIGPALSMSSTAVVVQVLSHEKRLGGPVGRATLPVLLLQDIAAVPVLFVIGVSGAGGDPLTSIDGPGGGGRARAYRRRPAGAAPAVPRCRAHRQPGAVRRRVPVGDPRHRTCHRHGRPADGTWLADRRAAVGRDRVPPPDRGDDRPVQRAVGRCVPDFRRHEPRSRRHRSRCAARRAGWDRAGGGEARHHRLSRAWLRAALADRIAGGIAAGTWRRVRLCHPGPRASRGADRRGCRALPAGACRCDDGMHSTAVDAWPTDGTRLARFTGHRSGAAVGAARRHFAARHHRWVRTRRRDRGHAAREAPRGLCSGGQRRRQCRRHNASCGDRFTGATSRRPSCCIACTSRQRAPLW